MVFEGGTGFDTFSAFDAFTGFATFTIFVVLDILVALTGFEICFLFIIYAIVVFLVPKKAVSASKFIK